MRLWIILALCAGALGLIALAFLYGPLKEEEAAHGIAESAPDRALEPPRPAAFLTLNLGPDGALSAAGQAASGATVTLSIDGKPRVQLRADEHGEWVLVLAEAFKPGDHGLSLSMRLPDARERAAEDMAVVHAPRRPGDAPLIALVREGGPSRLVQAEGMGEAKSPALRLVAADYRADGTALLSGQAEPGSIAHLFRGEVALGAAQAGSEGRWTLAVESAALGASQGPPMELRLVIKDEAGNESARAGAPLPLPPARIPLPKAAYARIAAEGQQWRITWRNSEGKLNSVSLYAAGATRVIEDLPTPEPRP